MNLANCVSEYISLPKPLMETLQTKCDSLEKEGITYLAHGILRQGKRTCFFNHPEWAEIFLSQKKYLVDPFTIMAETTAIPYIFWEDVPMDSKGRDVDLERKEVCKIRNGLTFSYHVYDFHEIIALGTSCRFLDIKSLVLNPHLNSYLSHLLQPLRYQHFQYLYKKESHYGY